MPTLTGHFQRPNPPLGEPYVPFCLLVAVAVILLLFTIGGGPGRACK